MAEDNDGIEETLAGQIRVMVTAAGLVGESIARLREQQQRRAQAASEQQARALELRLTAELHAARAELAGVHHPEWWGSATPERIGRAYQVARVWSREDPEAMRAQQRIRDELRSRYGIDAASANADPAAVRAAVEKAEQNRARGTSERTDAASDRAEAQLLLTRAELLERRAEESRQAAEHEAHPDERAAAVAEVEDREVSPEETRDAGGVPYDSAERRTATARDLEAHGFSQKAAAAKMFADVSQAKPAIEAAKSPGKGRLAKGRKTRGRAQIRRAGVER